MGLTLLLIGAIVGGVIGAWAIDPTASIVAAVVGFALYPGLAGIIAARSRSSDAAVAVATLLASLLFAGFVLIVIQTPYGWPGRRVTAIAIGCCLLFAGMLFGVLLVAARVARGGGALRGVAALGVGFIGAVVIAAPYLWLVVVLSAHTGVPA